MDFALEYQQPDGDGGREDREKRPCLGAGYGHAIE